MRIRLRMLRSLRGDMVHDLVRPHRFAAERVGFARTSFGTIEDGALLLVTSFWGVPDEQYVDDPRVGARINAVAIRGAMQDVLSGDHGLFHVHFHDHKGPTRLSKTDVTEIPKLVSSFRNVAPNRVHGLLVLTHDHATAFALPPKVMNLVQVSPITVVGYPTEVLI